MSDVLCEYPKSELGTRGVLSSIQQAREQIVDSNLEGRALTLPRQTLLPVSFPTASLSED